MARDHEVAEAQGETMETQETLRILGEILSSQLYHLSLYCILMAFAALAVGTWAAGREPWNPFRRRGDQRVYWVPLAEIERRMTDAIWRDFVIKVRAEDLPRFNIHDRNPAEQARYVQEVNRLEEETRSMRWRKSWEWYYVTYIRREQDSGTPDIPRRRILPIFGEGNENPELKIVMSKSTNLIYNILFYGSVFCLGAAIAFSFMPTFPGTCWFMGFVGLVLVVLVLMKFDAHGFYLVNQPDILIGRRIDGIVLWQSNGGGLDITPAGLTRADNNPDNSGKAPDFAVVDAKRTAKEVDMDYTFAFERREVPGGSNPIRLGTISVDAPSYMDAAADDNPGVAGTARKVVTSVSMWFSGVIATIRVWNAIMERVVLRDDIGPALRTAIGVAMTAATRIVLEHNPEADPDLHHPLLDGLAKPSQQYADAQAHRPVILEVARRFYNTWRPLFGVVIEELVSDDPFFVESTEKEREGLLGTRLRAAGDLVDIEVAGRRLETLGIKSAEQQRRVLDAVAQAQNVGVSPTQAFWASIALVLAPEILEMASQARRANKGGGSGNRTPNEGAP